MSTAGRVRVRVPATSANLGPGFDALALALGLYNDLRVESDPPRGRRGEGEAAAALRRLRLSVVVRGEGEGSLPRGKGHLVYRAMREVFARCGRVPDRVALRCSNRIPLARGLGSSAAATVGGLLAANALCGRPFAAEELLSIAAEIEGHPDNVSAAMLGGLVACCRAAEGVRAWRLPLANRYRAVVAVPDYELRTPTARRALPARVSRSDAVYSLARAAALVGLLAAGADEGLTEAMRDRLHQPYRAALLPGFEEALAAALAAGALGAALSGAGPSVIALVPRGAGALHERVAAAMVGAYRRRGLAAQAWVLRIALRGPTVRLG